MVSFRRKPRVHRVTAIGETSGRKVWYMPAPDFDHLFEDANVFSIDGQILGNLGSGDETIIVIREEAKKK